ncbi:MAG: BamA/TamA family outer membrane protein [Bacteroidetes bacterium]|nr:BamA/TamA family outer membrane protein [Bacteroidota bacterium]
MPTAIFYFFPRPMIIRFLPVTAMMTFVFILSFTVLGQSSGDTIKSTPSGLKAKPLKCDTCCQQKDLIDLFFKGDNPFYPKKDKRFRFFAIPLIAYDPATSLQLGLGGSFSLQLGKAADTKLSAGVASALYTLNDQFFIQYKGNIYFPHNKWFLQSDWRFYVFNLPTYTLGTNNQVAIPEVPGYKAVIVDPSLGGVYPMDYNWIRFHNVLSRRLTPLVNVGIGYHLDIHYSIADDNLLISNDTLYNTPHFAYSSLHGFNPGQYITSGLSANFVFDTRDDQVNAYRGVFINVSYRYNATWLGSSKNSSTLWTEFRTYIPLSKRCPRHLLAFWYFGSFVLSGEVPYLDLMSISYDQMNSSGRGYAQGRYRGEDFVYGEMEYRFPISPHSHILGGVIFTNVTTASNRDMHVPLFGYFQPAAGVGLRIMVGKHDRTNIAIDFGIGNMSQGLYVQTQEVF